MFEFSDNELVNLLNDDVPYLDNTSFGLGICGKANLCFFPKNDEIILCGVDECVKLAKTLDIECEFALENGAKIQPKERFFVSKRQGAGFASRGKNYAKFARTRKFCGKLHKNYA